MKTNSNLNPKHIQHSTEMFGKRKDPTEKGKPRDRI